MNRFPVRTGSAAVLFALFVLFGILHALSDLLPGERWEKVPLHSVMEAVGVLAAWLLAGLILQLPRTASEAASRRVWMACGLVTIGILDLFHAAVPPGNLFVWLHSMSLLVGGFLFALVWVPVPRLWLHRHAVTFSVAFLAAAFAFLSVQFANSIPGMVADSGFTLTATLINVAGGGLFFIAVIRFLVAGDPAAGREDIVFATLALLFALSGILFETSRLWNAEWWLWHLVRLFAYLLTAAYILHLFQSIQARLQQTNEALQQEIGRRKRDQEMLLVKSRELQRMNEELESFAYVASHDLKAPLRGVANLALMIDEDASGSLDEENRRRLCLLRERIRVLDGIIEGLLSYARLGRTQDRGCPVVLDAVLEQLVAELEIPRGFRVEVVKPLPTLYAAPLDVRQIFQNLVTNAIAHHDRPEGHVWISAAEDSDMWSIEVADDGPGIPSSERPNIFQMFTTSAGGTHTGIGLAIVRKLVLANGGDIEVFDRVPHGTVFRVHWPKHPQQRGEGP